MPWPRRAAAAAPRAGSNRRVRCCGGWIRRRQARKTKATDSDAPMSARIEDFAMIGDCRTAAIVCRTGSIDWLCLPRFDSAACFAALLGESEHGRWLIAPADPSHRVERRYLNGSLILVTMFETAGGAVEVVDFIGLRHGFSDIVRLVRGLRGRVSMQTEFILRFDYGAVVPWVERLPDGGISA